MVKSKFRIRSAAGYLAQFARDFVVESVLILSLTEAIFLAERFSEIFDEGADKHASTRELLLLLVSVIPEILDIALAIAILVAGYRVLLRAREDREFLVMASAGMSNAKLLWLMLGFGFVTFLISLFVSGSLAPAAQYLRREVLFNAEYRALRTGTSTPQFYFFPDHVVYVAAQTPKFPQRRIFILEQNNGGDRVITARHVALEGPDAKGLLSLRMQEFTAYDIDQGDARFGNQCINCASKDEIPRSVTVHAKDFVTQIEIKQLMRLDPRGVNVGEWTLGELIGVSTPPAPLGLTQIETLGDRLARALLGLIAPFIAFYAVIYTTRRTLLFALPFGCLALLALDLIATLLVNALAPAGITVLIFSLFLLLALLVATLAALIAKQTSKVALPALSRP